MSRIKQIISLTLFMVMLISAALPSQLYATGFAIMGTPLPRLAGANRYGTAVAISQEGWPTGADVIVLARGDEYADALAGVPLAYANDAPILLTAPTRLPVSTKEEIQRLGATTAYILGGAGAVSAAVENEVAQLGLTITRIEGKNRFDTAAKIAAVIAPGGASTVFLAYGQGFADALAASSYAAVLNAPILLTRTETLPDVTVAALSALNPTNTYVIGGEGVISAALFAGLANSTRIGGSNRYHTSVVLAELFAGTADSMFIATGVNESGGADAITGGALAAKRGNGILLVSKTLPSTVAAYLSENIQQATILGGDGAVSEALAQAVKGALYTPEPDSVTGISIKTSPLQTRYTEGDALDLDGLTVALAKSDGSEEDVPLADFAAKGIATEPANGSALTAADTVVTITHIESDKSVDQAIVVDSEVWVYYIYVNTLPHKTSYEAGEKLDLTGLEVRLLKTGGPSEDVPLADFDAKGIVTEPANGSVLTAADTKVQVTHTSSGRSVDVGINVIPGVAELGIFSPASKVNYMAGEKLSFQGLVVQLTREGGGTEQVPVANFTAKGIITDPVENTPLTGANTQVTITHKISGESTSYDITVGSQGIRIGNTTYKLGEDPLPEGLAWNAEQAQLEMDGYSGAGRITYESTVAKDLNIYVKSDSSITVGDQLALEFNNLVLAGVPGAKLTVCSSYSNAIYASTSLTVTDIDLTVEHSTTVGNGFSRAINGNTTVTGQGMLTIHSQRLATSRRDSNQGINGILTLKNSASASINVMGNEYTTDVWGISPFNSPAYKSLYLNGTGYCEISVVNEGIGVAQALYNQGETYGYNSIGAWDMDYVKYTRTHPGTDSIPYTPSGEITDIYPSNVAFASGQFTYPVGTTRFTFKQDGQPMKAVYSDGGWAFAPVPLFPVTLSIEGGTANVTVSPADLGEAGRWVQVMVRNIAAGKELQGVEVIDQDGDPVTVTAISSLDYIFIMPAKAVAVTVILHDLPPLVYIGETLVDLRDIPSQFSGISWNETDKQLVLNGYNGPYIHSADNSSAINASIRVEADSTIAGTANNEALLFYNGGMDILSDSGATLTLTSGYFRVVSCRGIALSGAGLVVEHEYSGSLGNFLRSLDCGLSLFAGSSLTLNVRYTGSADGQIYGINGLLRVGEGATAEITVGRAGGAGDTLGIKNEPVLWDGGACDITVINLGSGGGRPVFNNPVIANSHYARGTWDSYTGTMASPAAYTVKVPVAMDVLNLADINIAEANGGTTSFSLYTDAAYSAEVTNSMALTADPAGTIAYIKAGSDRYYKVTIIREDKPNTLGLLTGPFTTYTLG